MGWKFRASPLKKPDDYTVERSGIGDDRVIRIIINPGELSGPGQGAGTEELIQLSFSVPYLKTESRYLVKLPEPVKDPKIEFKVHFDGAPVRAFMFFASALKVNSKPIPLANPNEIVIGAQGWTFPESGVVFVWRTA